MRAVWVISYEQKWVNSRERRGASADNTAEAAEKGRIVQAKAEELKNQLGMNETLASNPPASAS